MFPSGRMVEELQHISISLFAEEARASNPNERAPASPTSSRPPSPGIMLINVIYEYLAYIQSNSVVKGLLNNQEYCPNHVTGTETKSRLVRHWWCLCKYS